MTNLKKFSPRTSYPDILTLDGNQAGLKDFVLNVQDGVGRNACFQLSTLRLNMINGTTFSYNGYEILRQNYGMGVPQYAFGQTPPPIEGTIYYDTTAKIFYGCTDEGWKELGGNI